MHGRMSACQKDVNSRKIGNASKCIIQGGKVLALHHPWPCGLSELPNGTHVCHSVGEHHGMSGLERYFEKGLSMIVSNDTNVSILRPTHVSKVGICTCYLERML